MKHKYIQRKRRIIYILSCIVVFITVYSLVLPAITIDRETAGEDNGININDDYTSDSQEESFANDAGIFEGETDGISYAAEDTEKEANEFNELLKEEQEKEKQMVDSVSYPSVSFSDTLNDAIIRVSAPEGAFPEGTIMKVEEVEE